MSESLLPFLAAGSVFALTVGWLAIDVERIRDRLRRLRGRL